MITVSKISVFPPTEKFPLSLFIDIVKPVLAIISGMFREDNASRVTDAFLVFLDLKMQPKFLLGIPSFLASTVKAHFQHLSTSIYFKYY